MRFKVCSELWRNVYANAIIWSVNIENIVAHRLESMPFSTPSLFLSCISITLQIKKKMFNLLHKLPPGKS